MTDQDTTPNTADASAAADSTTSGSGRGAAPAVPIASSDPARWGRVDSEGQVYVHTSTGERFVGSWQAGEPTEGLAHFARRFDDLRTEAELLETRISTGSGDPKQALSNAKHLRDGLPEASVVGDVDSLAARIDHIVERAEHAVEHAKAEREKARAEAVARKEALVAEAEQIGAEATNWKAAGDRLKAIFDEWKTIKGVDRKTDEALWKRFTKARDAFNRRRGSHFAELDRQRNVAKERKQELVNEAESLTESTDWGPTADRYKQLMAEWKSVGRAPRDSDEALWKRFRAAQDRFFARRSEAFAERDAEFAENARLKEELLAEAERIDPDADLSAAQSQLQRIQRRWDEIGKVPRERMRELEGRLRAVNDRVRSAEQAHWRQTDPEAQARVDQFRERVQQYEQQAQKARSAGDEKRAKEADRQAQQWREWLTAAENALADR
ncbi:MULTISPECIES: DUF349 domain-containing protein [unclassified Actinopolyspora]|uniref:DUF349 domain-containing protein n=1 Tax=Actinopolyspora TaxID=1849 RepID=UPI0013F5F06B|nr:MULTISPECIES: DUF349 domain-containing protein [unclassified Actinopolyspora]NHD17389.1 DUF349 domain-containing protein [Actinopolyspora sp. BKK2]NHE76878.1 DUF349 domain-containing protein [Actinopolyspora sp. BKK1]